MNKKILEFTYAEYSMESRVMDLSMVALSFIPHIIAIVITTRAVSLRSLHHFIFFVGFVVCHVAAVFLKGVWKESRPTGSFLSSYGLPSDHSQIMFFTSIYLLSYMREKMNLQLWSLLLSTLCLASLSVGVACSRLYLGVHSMKQVVVGGLLGVFIGRFWYILTVQILLRSKRLSRLFDGTYDSIEKVFCSTRKRSAR